MLPWMLACGGSRSGVQAWTPDQLGAGPWFSVRDSLAQNGIWQDASKTIPADADGELIRKLTWLFSGPGADFSAVADTNRPTLKTSGDGVWWFETDGVNDLLTATASWSGSYTIGWSGRLLAAGDFPLVVSLKDGVEELRGNSTSGRLEMHSFALVSATDDTSSVGTDVAVIATSSGATGDVKLHIDGVQQASANTAGTRVVDLVNIGSRTGGTIPSNARTYGLAVMSSVVSGNDLTSLNDWLVSLRSPP